LISVIPFNLPAFIVFFALSGTSANALYVEAAVCTFADVYDMWSKAKFPTVSKVAQYGYVAAFKHSEAIHSIKMRDLKTKEMENVIQTVNGGYQVQSKIKTLYNQLFKYALEHDIVQKDYSTFVKLRDKAPETSRDAIAKKDIERLWEEVDKGNETAEIAMIYIYTGLRATELLEILKKNVDVEKRMMIGGKKTDAGKDRRIPIHRAILPLIEKRMAEDGEYLITKVRVGKRKPISYQRFVDTHWNKLMESLDMEYTMHYTRHTCATMMREAGIEEDLRKLILGHKNDDITDRYTHHSDEMLLEAIDKLKGR